MVGQQANPLLRRKRNLSKSKLSQRCDFTFLVIILISLLILSINEFATTCTISDIMLSASHDVMLETRSSPTKKNLDEQAGKVTVTDNILQEEHQIIGRSTTPKGQRKEELMLTTIADPSPKHLQKSFTSLERAKVCNVEGVIDELSFAVIAKIRRGIIKIQRREQQQRSKSKRTKPRILCMVYTYNGTHASNLQAIVDTWAAQCDGFFAASNVTDVGLGAVNIKNIT